MRVKKRNGSYEQVSFDKITQRLQSLINTKPILNLDSTFISQKVCSEIYDGIETSLLDKLTSEIVIAMLPDNIDYGELASRLVISDHHKKTSDDYLQVIELLYNNSIVSKKYYDLVLLNIDRIHSEINYENDYKFDYFGFKTLEKSYLFKVNGDIIERPQHMYIRVALSIHRNDIDMAMDTYRRLSNHEFIHATPTLYNAGTNREQFASCFLLSMEDDSVVGIYDTLKDCAIISQSSGGIGLHIHNIRASGSRIIGTNGISNGLVPMLRVFNDTARYIDQGGGKRNGSIAIYLEPWHADIIEFLELKKNHGNELERARDLFYSMWIPDLFMERVEQNGVWSLFCPNKCKDLCELYGENFNNKYLEYENSGLYEKQISAQKLWFSILNTQIETGTPYLLYKDACNEKSNQKNLGTIKSSNLCTEIVEYSSPTETAVCNLASISLPNCIVYDISKLMDNYVIYSIPNCIYCTAAKNLFKKYNINYTEKSHNDITLSTFPPYNVTFPKIYKNNNELIGGYEELEKYLSPTFDYHKLQEITKVLVKNLNNIIDYNYYPTDKTERSNRRHRPIGIGVQGLVNVFYEMNIPFDSDEAKNVNKLIFENIYYASLEASMEISKERENIVKEYKKLYNDYNSNLHTRSDDENEVIYTVMNNIKDQNYIIDEELDRDEYFGTYSSYIDSPIYNGILQFDMWKDSDYTELTNDWDYLREYIKKYGIRNSLLVAPMPTASTSQILKNYECFEPIISNIYSRRVLSGEYIVINKYLINDLMLFEKWDTEMKEMLIASNGSVQNLNIPSFLKNKYKTAWEIKQKNIIDMAADRGKFICQSQSMNLFQENPNYKKLTSMHFYAWKKGLKTGMYYLRSRPSSKPIQFTIAPEVCESCSG
uniref:ribonucleoside-diphosphate reductase n=1 Tax=viral metagenome TaxID=1070528 RepID=A0A6C0CWX8_9ZZZZ